MVNRVSDWLRAMGPDSRRKEQPDRKNCRPRAKSKRQHILCNYTRFSVIVGVCQQDPDRCREFDTIFQTNLESYLNKRGVTEPDAGDIVQDIFVKLPNKIHTCDRSRDKFRSWLFSVAQNTLIDRARRRVPEGPGRTVVHVLRDTPANSHQMAEEWVKIHCDKILAHAVKTVRATVSSKSWVCFAQRLLCNRPAAEIAAELKIEPNAVYVNGCRFAPI
jgi:RNA polymerase sigma factor (sigma-70 family)